MDEEAVLAAHDALHKDDVRSAHECLHKALGVDNEMPLPIAPLGHLGGFDQGFRTACRKNNVRAAYIVIDPHHQSDDGKSRIIAGGDAELAAMMGRLMRGKP